MKRFSILCCLVLLLNVLCPVGHVHAEGITTPTDLCDHEYGYWADGDECVYGCTVCKEENFRTSHEASCAHPNCCTHCGQEGFYPITHYYGDAGRSVSDGAEGHHLVCPGCGKITKEKHYANCDEPTHCAACDYEGEIARVDHYFDYNSQGFDKNGHWATCSKCSSKGNSVAHLATCDDPTHCVDCGYVGTINNVSHGCMACTSDGADGHTWTCTNCDYSYTSSHSAPCTDPTHCDSIGCGYEGEIDSLTHNSGVYTYSAEGHTWTCTKCDYSYTDFHSASCTDPTHCNSCGYEGEINNLLHDYVYTSNGASGHTLNCLNCDFYSNNFSHSAKCDDPTHCISCDYEGEIKELWHDWSELVPVDETVHGHTCVKCGVKKSYGHFASCSNPTHCLSCG